jgi:hypothetical protein
MIHGRYRQAKSRKRSRILVSDVGETWTFADVLVLAAIITRHDLGDFSVRRVLKRVELGELRPREAALRLVAQFEMLDDEA